MAFLLMKSEERPAVVLLALPIRRPLRREPPVLATLHTCARPAAVLGISLRDYRGLSPYLLTGSRCPKSGGLTTHTYARRFSFFRAFLHNAKEIVPGQLEHQQCHHAQYHAVAVGAEAR